MSYCWLPRQGPLPADVITGFGKPYVFVCMKRCTSCGVQRKTLFSNKPMHKTGPARVYFMYFCFTSL